MPLDPGGDPLLLIAPAVEGCQHLGRELGGFAGGQETSESPIDRLGRRLAQDRHMPDLIEMEAIGREIDLAPGPEDRLLSVLIHLRGRGFAGEARSVMVARLLPFRGRLAAAMFG
jgi:hypothetical protein